MKKIFLSLVLALLAIHGFGQTPDCTKFREGNFVMEDLSNGNTQISRIGNVQTEYQEYTKLKIEFEVKWKDDCQYSLKVKKVLENPRGLKVPMDLIVNVKILETKKDTYVQQSSSKGIDLLFTSEVRKID